MKKGRIIAWLLTVSLCISMFPANIIASEVSEDEGTVISEELESESEEADSSEDILEEDSLPVEIVEDSEENEIVSRSASDDEMIVDSISEILDDSKTEEEISGEEVTSTENENLVDETDPAENKQATLDTVDEEFALSEDNDSEVNIENKTSEQYQEDNAQEIRVLDYDQLLTALPNTVQNNVADHYWYIQLSELEKVIYCLLLEQLDSKTTDRITGMEGFSQEEVDESMIFAQEALKLDQPWLSSLINNVHWTFDEETLDVSIEFCSYSEYQQEKAHARLRQIKETAGTGDRYVQIRNILSFINRHIVYDTSAMPIFELDFLNEGASYNIMGGLLWDSSVCMGLSYIFKAICDDLDIPCIIVEGCGPGQDWTHAWNAVQMEDDKWYCIDCTNFTMNREFSEEWILRNGEDFSQFTEQGILHWSGTYTKYSIPPISSEMYKYEGVYDESMYKEAENEFVDSERKFYYEVLEDNKCRIISYEGSTDGDLVIPESIDGYIVSEIGSEVFANGRHFQGRLILPDTIEQIRQGAFINCVNLNGELHLPSNLRIIGKDAFRSCNRLGGGKDLVLPSTLEEIGSNAFLGARGFAGTIYIPEKIKNIEHVFDQCTGIDCFRVDSANPYLCDVNGVVFTKDMTRLVRYPEKKSGQVIIPEGVLSIGQNAFYCCWSIDGSLTLPDSLVEIDNGAFMMTGIKGDLVIPDQVTRIGRMAFFHGEDGYTGIELRGFGGSLILGKGIQIIEGRAFQGCLFENELVLPEGITEIGEYAFDNCGFSGKLQLPQQLTEIKECAFNCNHFTGDLKIPDNVQKVEDHAFCSCTFGGSLILNNALCSVSQYAFANCGFTGELIIPASLSEIEDNAFRENGFSGVICSCGASCNMTTLEEPCIEPFVWGKEAFVCPNCGRIYAENSIDPEAVYTIEYVMDGGRNNPNNPATYSYNTESITLRDPVKTGYTFDGWFGDEELSQPFDVIPQGTTGDLTIYAKWTPHRYSLALQAPDATGVFKSNWVDCVYDEPVILQAEMFYRTNYALIGWSTEPDGTGDFYPVDQELVNLVESGVLELYAVWEADTYQILFDGNGATSGEMSAQYCALETENELAANAYTKRGYTFTGWNTEADGSGTSYADKQLVSGLCAAKDETFTLFAQWKIKAYTITYKLNGGTNNSSNPKSYYVTTAKITLKNPTRKGYKFGGWYSDSALTKQVTAIAQGSIGNRTLYAKWTKIKYTITYKLNGGTNNSSNPKSYYVTTAKITLKNPTRKGYKFAGWYSNSALTKKVTTIAKGSTGNKTLYAKWTKIKYTITYQLNGGTNNSKNPKSYYVTTATITLKNPTRKGYKFVGWYSNKALTKKVTTIPKGSTGNKTMYAKWKKS